MARPLALIVSVETGDYYQGFAVRINGVQVAHRPYDGSSAEEVELEIVETFGALLRRETGWAREADPNA